MYGYYFNSFFFFMIYPVAKVLQIKKLIDILLGAGENQSIVSSPVLFLNW